MTPMWTAEQIKDNLQDIVDEAIDEVIDETIENTKEEFRSLMSSMLQKAANRERIRQDADEKIALALERAAEAVANDDEDLLDRPR